MRLESSYSQNVVPINQYVIYIDSDYYKHYSLSLGKVAMINMKLVEVSQSENLKQFEVPLGKTCFKLYKDLCN